MTKKDVVDKLVEKYNLCSIRVVEAIIREESVFQRYLWTYIISSQGNSKELSESVSFSSLVFSSSVFSSSSSSSSSSSFSFPFPSLSSLSFLFPRNSIPHPRHPAQHHFQGAAVSQLKQRHPLQRSRHCFRCRHQTHHPGYDRYRAVSYPLRIQLVKFSVFFRDPPTFPLQPP